MARRSAPSRTASEHGLNGMVLAAGLDRIDLQPEAWFSRAERVKRIAHEAGRELIPIRFDHEGPRSARWPAAASGRTSPCA